MNLSTSLDVAIGLLLIFLLGSLAVSGFTELFAYFTKKRSKELWKAIHRLLDTEPPPKDPRPVNDGGTTNDPIAQAIYDSPLITEFRAISDGTKTQINKLKACDFTQALIQSRVPDRATLNDTGIVQKLRDSMPANAPLRKALEAFADETNDNLQEIIKRLETWYDSQMERVSRVYKRYARWIALVVGLVVAGVANVNVIYIAETFNRDQATRATFAKSATALVDKCKGDETDDQQTKEKKAANLTTCVHEQQISLGTTVDVPFGWKNKSAPNFDEWPSEGTWKLLPWVLAGWILAGLAFMQGGPFWFDLMKRLVSMRGGSSAGG